MKLFDILLPREGICTETSLFYKLINGSAVYEESALFFEDDATVSFESFLNCFSSEKYKKYTDTDTIVINLDLEGEFDIIVESVTYGKRKILSTGKLNNINNSIEISLDDCFSIGYLTFSLTSKGRGKMLGGRYLRKASAVRNIKVGIVICTFRREQYVLANLDRICKYAETEPQLKNSLHVFVVDNGGTLDKSIENSRVTLINNPNLGGSGGFSRGMLEVYERRGEGFTHMHLMDDDVVFFPETLQKTYAFLACVTAEHEDVSIGAAMLRLDRKYHQHEFGAMWTGLRISPFNNDCDLRKVSSLISNERADNPPYSAWWYMCMPAKFVGQYGLALPFFIKGDDVEYALRACKGIVMLNGVGVWHEPFNLKFSAELEYYVKRNEAIISSAYPPRQNAISHIFKLMRSTAYQLICFRYDWANLYFKAYNDFLKGPDYFNSLDIEALHKELRTYNSKSKSKQELMQELGLSDIQFTPLSKKQSPRLLRYTLNGYLIPKAFYKFCKYNDSGFRIVNSSDLKMRGFFCTDKVLIYNPHNETGYVVVQNKRMLFLFGFKLIAMFFKLVFKYKKTAKAYKNNIEKLASIESWKPKMKLL